MLLRISSDVSDFNLPNILIQRNSTFNDIINVKIKFSICVITEIYFRLSVARTKLMDKCVVQSFTIIY